MNLLIILIIKNFHEEYKKTGLYLGYLNFYLKIIIKSDHFFGEMQHRICAVYILLLHP